MSRSRIRPTTKCALVRPAMVRVSRQYETSVDVHWFWFSLYIFVHHTFTIVEVLYIELNDPQKHFEELIRFFFTFHDPTTKNRQGNDSGFQYASFIFCGDEEQVRIAQKVRDELQTLMDKGRVRQFRNKSVTTKIGPLTKFTEALKAHQDYLAKNPNGYWWVKTYAISTLCAVIICGYWLRFECLTTAVFNYFPRSNHYIRLKEWPAVGTKKQDEEAEQPQKSW